MKRQHRLWFVALATTLSAAGPACHGSKTLVASGRFELQIGRDRGSASIYRLADGGLLLDLSLPVPPRPEMDVRLIPADRTPHGEQSGFLVVGRLFDPRPTQQHFVPPGIDLDRYGAVCIWSRADAACVATAPLAHPLQRSSPQ